MAGGSEGPGHERRAKGAGGRGSECRRRAMGEAAEGDRRWAAVGGGQR